MNFSILEDKEGPIKFWEFKEFMFGVDIKFRVIELFIFPFVFNICDN